MTGPGSDDEDMMSFSNSENLDSSNISINYPRKNNEVNIDSDGFEIRFKEEVESEVEIRLK